MASKKTKLKQKNAAKKAQQSQKARTAPASAPDAWDGHIANPEAHLVNQPFDLSGQNFTDPKISERVSTSQGWEGHVSEPEAFLSPDEISVGQQRAARAQRATVGSGEPIMTVSGAQTQQDGTYDAPVTGTAQSAPMTDEELPQGLDGVAANEKDNLIDAQIREALQEVNVSRAIKMPTMTTEEQGRLIDAYLGEVTSSNYSQEGYVEDTVRLAAALGITDFDALRNRIAGRIQALNAQTRSEEAPQPAATPEEKPSSASLSRENRLMDGFLETLDDDGISTEDRHVLFQELRKELGNPPEKELGERLTRRMEETFIPNPIDINIRKRQSEPVQEEASHVPLTKEQEDALIDAHIEALQENPSPGVMQEKFKKLSEALGNLDEDATLARVLKRVAEFEPQEQSEAPFAEVKGTPPSSEEQAPRQPLTKEQEDALIDEYNALSFDRTPDTEWAAYSKLMEGLGTRDPNIIYARMDQRERELIAKERAARHVDPGAPLFEDGEIDDLYNALADETQTGPQAPNDSAKKPTDGPHIPEFLAAAVAAEAASTRTTQQPDPAPVDTISPKDSLSTRKEPTADVGGIQINPPLEGEPTDTPPVDEKTAKETTKPKNPHAEQHKSQGMSLKTAGLALAGVGTVAVLGLMAAFKAASHAVTSPPSGIGALCGAVVGAAAAVYFAARDPLKRQQERWWLKAAGTGAVIGGIGGAYPVLGLPAAAYFAYSALKKGKRQKATINQQTNTGFTGPIAAPADDEILNAPSFLREALEAERAAKGLNTPKAPKKKFNIKTPRKSAVLKWTGKTLGHPAILGGLTGIGIRFAFGAAALSLTNPVVAAIGVGFAAGAASRFVSAAFDKNKRAEKGWVKKSLLKGGLTGAGFGILGTLGADWFINNTSFGHWVADHVGGWLHFGEQTPTDPSAFNNSVSSSGNAHAADLPKQYVQTSTTPAGTGVLAQSTGAATKTGNLIVDQATQHRGYAGADLLNSHGASHVAQSAIEVAAQSDTIDVHSMLSESQLRSLPRRLQEMAASKNPAKLLAFCDQAAHHLYNHAPNSQAAQEASARLVDAAVKFADGNNIHSSVVNHLHANRAFFLGHGIGGTQNVSEAVRSATASHGAVHNFGDKLVKLLHAKRLIGPKI